MEETFSHITLAHKLGYLDDGQYKEISTALEELHKMINGYIGFLKRSKRGANEPGSARIIREETTVYPLYEDIESSTNTPNT